MTDQTESTSRRQLPSSYISAFVILAVVVLYFAIGTIFGGSEQTEAATETERPPFTVLVRNVSGEARAETLTFSGRTEAAQRVYVRAETPGRVARIVNDEGAEVSRGDVLCRLEADSRQATRAEAEAAFAKASADFDAAQTLHAEGFASDTALKQARAARDAAEAALSRASDDLRNISVTAPFDGLVAEMIAEPGDVLSVGAPCAVIANLSRMIMAGGVPARDAARISVGDKAHVRLIDEREFDAEVRFVSDVADPATRTFRVEILAEDASGIPEGIETRATVTAGTKASTLIPRNALVYSDEGVLGVRTVSPSGESRKDGEETLPLGTVRFMPVTIIGEAEGGAYVTGLDETASLIVRGQDYVSDGITVTFAQEASE
ncbi:efflux RND transporter periplasmic adaptor subunit [Parvularcula marina]|uniref:efflux RND transporter periplasmic adaptor subunit n=1 Tax=Parvularcula marina TaxID=2292771 RepID=UPI0035128029